MLGTYYYNEIIRKTIIAFGTLFNDIHIKHKDNSESVISDMKVGLSYGPMQKFLAKIEQQEDLTKPVAITLPRMSFEMNNIAYDSTRKTGITQTFKTVSDDSKQILPFFQPSFNVTVDLVESIGEKRDVPIVLDSIDFQDDYEGSFQTRRALIYTLRFTAKTYLFGPIADSTDGLIRKVQVDLYADTNTKTAKREMRYTAVPDPIDAEPGDDFGFTENWEFLGDSREFSPTKKEDY